MDVTQLTTGDRLPEGRFILDADAVHAYRTAVGDSSPVYQGAPSIVPPTAVAALSLRHMLDVLVLPPGAVHASQEMTFQRSVAVGQEMVCRAHVSQAAQRRQWWLLSVDFQVDLYQSATSITVITGRTTLFINLEDSA